MTASEIRSTPAPPPSPARARPCRAPRPWLAAAVAAAQLALVGPLLIFVDNRREFVGGSWLAVLYLLAAWLLATSVLAVPGLLPRAGRRVSAVLLACTLAMWGQSFVTGRYGLLDGTRVDWSAERGGEVLSWLAWAALLGLAALAADRLLPWLWRLAVLVLVVQVGAAAFTLATAPGLAGRDRDLEDLARFGALSAERNLLVLVLDGVRGREAEEVLRGDEALRRGFDGFRFFPDHLAAFPTTRFSVPAMLSTEVFDNREPADRYLDRALRGEGSVAVRLRAAGFDVGVATTIHSLLDVPADVTVAAEHYSLTRARRAALGLELLDLSLFRHLPLTLKRWVFDDDRWRVRRLFGATADYHPLRSLRFVEGLAAHLRAELAAPAFRFVHVGGAHVPVVVDAECAFIGVQPETRDAYRGQVACALRQARRLLERLAEIGLLDATFVVVTSDHGTFLREDDAVEATAVGRVLGMADALLMVKELGARGDMEFDPRPTAGAELASLLLAAAACEPACGPDAYLPPVPAAGRTARFHEWQHRDWRLPYVTSLHEFRVAADAGRQSSWRYVGTAVSPALAPVERDEQLRIGQRMSEALEDERRAAAAGRESLGSGGDS